jgi:hypothetical protein
MPDHGHIDFVDFDADRANLIALGDGQYTFNGASLARHVTQIAQPLGQRRPL